MLHCSMWRMFQKQQVLSKVWWQLPCTFTAEPARGLMVLVVRAHREDEGEVSGITLSLPSSTPAKMMNQISITDLSKMRDQEYHSALPRQKQPIINNLQTNSCGSEWGSVKKLSIPTEGTERLAPEKKEGLISPPIVPQATQLNDEGPPPVSSPGA